MTLELLDIKPLNTHHGNITPAVPGSHGNMDYRVGEVEDRERPGLPGGVGKGLGRTARRSRVTYVTNGST